MLNFPFNTDQWEFSPRQSVVSLFFSNFTYYKMSNLDNRIANADQLLTQVSVCGGLLVYLKSFCFVFWKPQMQNLVSVCG